jgi:N-glycosylase/DNA lyase
MDIPLDQTVTPFNLDHTLTCGQSFRWEKHDDWWYGVVRDEIVKIRQPRDKLQFETFPEKMNTTSLSEYFRLDDALPLILSRINKDAHIHRAIQNFRGLRIIRQEPWECLISYICATYKNIPAIQEMILNLSKCFGKKIPFDNHDFYKFPEPKDLATASLEELKRCKLGFRAENVSETSKIIHEKRFDLDALKEMSYERAKRKLLSLPGVGQKVADCVLLFSLDKLEAFPVDVWIKWATLEFYADHFERSFLESISSKRSITPNQYRKINSFGREHFGEYAGYAQEYLFALSRKQQKTCIGSS